MLPFVSILRSPLCDYAPEDVCSRLPLWRRQRLSATLLELQSPRLKVGAGPRPALQPRGSRWPRSSLSVALSLHPPPPPQTNRVTQRLGMLECAGRGLPVLMVCDAFSRSFSGPFSFKIISVHEGNNPLAEAAPQEQTCRLFSASSTKNPEISRPALSCQLVFSRSFSPPLGVC